MLKTEETANLPVSIHNDIYYIYVIVGANYMLPIIKMFEYLPKDINLVILTNTPGILKDIKVDFNLIVDDLEKYRDDWSRENEPLIDIDDEQGYMDEYNRSYFEDNYRFPCNIYRFGIKWAIQNNIKKFMLCDSGCKINFDSQITNTAIERLNSFYEKKDLVIGHTFDGNRDELHYMVFNSTNPYFEIMKKYIPIENIDDNQYVNLGLNKTEHSDNGVTDSTIGFDGYCLGFFVHNIDKLKIAYNLWCDLLEVAYSIKIIDPKKYHQALIHTEFIFIMIADVLSRIHKTLVTAHQGIVRHVYHPENDFGTLTVHKMPHLKDRFKLTKTRKEFLKENRQTLIEHFSEGLAKQFIHGFE